MKKRLITLHYSICADALLIEIEGGFPDAIELHFLKPTSSEAGSSKSSHGSKHSGKSESSGKSEPSGKSESSGKSSEERSKGKGKGKDEDKSKGEKDDTKSMFQMDHYQLSGNQHLYIGKEIPNLGKTFALKVSSKTLQNC